MLMTDYSSKLLNLEDVIITGVENIGCKTSHSLRSSVYNLIKIKAETPSDNLPRYSADYLRVLFLL